MESLLNNSAFLFWAAVTLMVVVPSIAHYCYKARKDQLEVELKQSMLDRGMSADEIDRVLSAGQEKPVHFNGNVFVNESHEDNPV